MIKEELKQKLLQTRKISDFSKYYKEFPEYGSVISSAIIQTIKETVEGGNRFSRYEIQSLMPLHKQIGIDRSSKKVEQKSYLPFTTQKAYAELRSFLKTKGDVVPLTEIRKQSFFQEPNLKQWLLAEYPKGLSYEDVGNFWLYYSGEEKSYTVMQGEYSQDIQTLDSVKDFPRKTFILTIDDLLEEIGKADDYSYEVFVNQILANGVHEESVGIPGKTFGWIIYREIDENTLFIEQAQTDLYRIFHRIRKGLEHFGLPEAMYRNIVNSLGGDDKVEEIEDTISKYVANYFEVLLSAFMEEFRGKELYLSTPEVILKSVPDDPPAHIYKKVPEKFRFNKIPAEQAPFNTEGLPVYYKHNASHKIKKYSKLLGG
jgi:hypothetical protein